MRNGRLGFLEAMRLAATKATLADLWDRLAEVYGARIAFTLEQSLDLKVLHARELTYQDLQEVVARMAGGLRAHGVRRGDRVALCGENRVDYALAIFAIARCGAVAVPLHHHLRAGEVSTLVRQARAGYLLAEPGLGAEPTGRVSTGKVRGVVTLTFGAGGDLDRATAEASPLAPEVIAPEDPVAILFTSGTTGVPKGATLTSRSLLGIARLAALIPDTREDSGVCGLPLAHVMGLSTFLFTALAGAPMHWLTKFDAEKVLEIIGERRATFFIGVPAMYAMMAEAGPEAYDLSSVRLWASSADAMPPALVTRFRALGCSLHSPLGQRLFTSAFAEIYGMVELSGPAILKLTPPEPFATRALAARATDRVKRAAQRARGIAAKVPGLESLGAESQASFGVPIPPYRARIVDDAGKPVRSGEVGELVLKGPGVSKGYDRGGTAMQDGWLRTGDLAKKNRLGLIAFVTRKKDVLKHGGFSVYPAEVEAQLTAHPAISEAVVFGAPHATKGAIPVGVVVLARGKKATVQELLAWARANIAPFKAPRALVIVAAQDIPRNANKKVLKDALRETTLPALQKQLEK